MKHLQNFKTKVYSIILLVFTAMALNAQVPIASPIPDCMKTNSLNISTGINEGGSFYSPCANDGYWRITSTDDGQSVPMCAKVYDYLGFSPFNLQNCRAIGVVCNGNVTNNANVFCNLKNGHSYYTFERQFYADITSSVTANLSVSVAWDDKISSFSINGYSTSTNCQPASQNIITPITINPGINKIVVQILNRQVGSGGSSPMRFALTGSVISNNLIFVTNMHYKPNTSIASQPWACYAPTMLLSKPILTNYCIPLGANSTNVTISNYNPSLYYTVIPGSFSAPGVFVGTANTTYTVTAYGLLGCSLSTVVKVKDKPSLTFITPKLCTNTAGVSATLQVKGISTSPPLSFTNLNTSTVFATSVANNTVVNNVLTTPNVYTINVVDANGCSNTGTLTYQYMQKLTAASYASICPGQSATVTMPTIVVNPSSSLTYAWLPGNMTTNPVTVTPSATTSYTCTVKSSIGCESTNLLGVHVKQKPMVTVTSNKANCSPTFTASSSNTFGNTYSWSGILGSQTGSTVTAPLSVAPALPLSGTFTVTCTDAGGCTGTSTGAYVQNPFCCNPSVFTTPGIVPKFSSNQPYNNGNSAAIISSLGSTINNYANPILFDGIIVINQSITFNNCPNILFSPNTQIVVSNGASLIFDNCKLRAECNYMWRGIWALSIAESIQFYDSEIKDMEIGLSSENGAVLKLVNNKFINNQRSIRIQNAPSNFTNANGNCIIVRNHFYTQSGTFLLNPNASLNRGRFGITISNCRSVEIGKLDLGASTNVFENLITGINIIHGSLGQIEEYKIYNNRFENIKNQYNWPETTINSLIPLSSQGAGIYVNPISGFTNLHKLIVEYDVQIDNGFIDCDKAIVGHKNTSRIMMPGIINCFFGIGMYEANAEQHIIENGFFNSCFQSIYVNGMMFNGSSIGSNNIYLRQGPITGTTTAPIGIKIDQISNAWNASIRIENNNIKILHPSQGAGIYLNKTGQNTIIDNNHILFLTTTPQLPTFGAISAGIYASKCKGTRFEENTMEGPSNQVLVNQANMFSGMKLSESNFVTLKCNKFIKTKYGLYVEGDCGSNNLFTDKVKGNDFKWHQYGMYFVDIATQGSIGNIGSLSSTLDYKNTFANANLGNGYGVFRTGTLPFPNSIYTNAIGFSYSGPAGNTRYGINNTSTNEYSCSTLNFSAMISSNFSPQSAIDIVNNNVPYNAFNSVGSSIQKQELWRELHYNIPFRNSNTVFQQFYLNEQNSDEGLLAKVDLISDLLLDTIIVLDSIAIDSLVNIAQQFANNVSSTNAMNLSEKAIVYYVAKAIKNELETLSLTEITTLENLANQCPFVGGKGVYAARTIYAYFDPAKTYNEEDLCISATAMKGVGNTESDNVNSISALKIYPNPASEHFNIEYSFSVATKYELVMTDMMGKKLKTTQLLHISGKEKIQTNDLSKGVYFCNIYSNGKLIETQKLIIQ